MKKVHIKYWISNNFGDALNEQLIKWINPNLKIIATKRNVPLLIKIKKLIKILPKENYVPMGSILFLTDKNSIVWGSGFISEDSYCGIKPKKVLAVRGPLTRKKLLKEKINCPEIYGDPALLLPKFYKPKIKKIYELGIVPHEVDKKNNFLKRIKNSKIKIININQEPKKVIRNILSCKKIASSSLHGIIVADAYKIPSIWIEFSDKVIGKGFKFRDYFESVGRKEKNPLRITKKTEIKEIMRKFNKDPIQINIDKLLEVCPFNEK
jgi:pyruvyltransferase